MFSKRLERCIFGDIEAPTDSYIAIDEKPSCDECGTRWVMLFLFSCVAAVNAFMFMSISPIASLVGTYYGVSEEMVNWTAQGVYLGFMLALPIMLYTSRKLGLRRTLVVSALLTAAGAALRMVPSHGIEWVLGGSVVVGFGCAFLLGIPPWISMHWFPEHEQTIATAIGTLATQIGLFFGYVVPPLVVTDLNVEKSLPALLLVTALVAIGLVFVVMSFFVEKRGTKEEDNASWDVTDPNGMLWMLFAAVQFGTATGLCWTFAVVLEEALGQIYSIKTICLLGSLYLLGGSFIMIGTGFFLDRFETPPYKSFIVGCLALSTAFLGLFYALVGHAEYFGFLTLVVVSLGMTISAVQPAYLMLVVEITSPLPEEVSGSVMYFVAMLMSFLLPFLFMFGASKCLMMFGAVSGLTTLASLLLPSKK